MRVLFGALTALVPVGIVAVLLVRLSRTIHLPWRDVAFVGGAGVALGAGAMWAQHFGFALTGLGQDVATVGMASALLATFLFAAPLEEGLKLVPVWPLYTGGRLDSRRLGVTFAATSAAGFAAVESFWVVWSSEPAALAWLRALLLAPAHLFFAGAWGYALGSRGRSKWFPVAWILATLAHGLYDHVVVGRGPAFLVGAFPLLGAMALLGYVALRDLAPVSGSTSRRAFSILPEPPSLRAMQRALRKTERPLMVRWIVVGAFVTLGVILVSLALAVYAGHRLGIDFALVNEEDVRSSGPLVLMGAAALLAFPIAGFLVARASAAHSVLEPALGASITIALLTVLLSMTSPVALVFALAMAPVAFGLACGGAWFGMDR